MTDEPGFSISLARQRNWRGGCLRGLVWAVLLETAGVLTMTFLVYGWHALHL